MNKKRYLPLLVAMLCKPAAAVELGPMYYSSRLNQPLQARLSLSDVDEAEIAELRFSLADRATYSHYRLRPPFDPAAMDIDVMATDSGGYKLHIRSREQLSDPIVDILIQVRSRQGGFIRRYTLLLDPPGIAPRARQPVARKDASSASAGAITQRSGAAKTPAASGEVTKTASTGHKTVEVRGTSISLIAENSELYPRYSVYQIMRAFYLTNTSAFVNGNIDKLNYGSRLLMPPESLVAEVPRRRAIEFVNSVSRDYPDTAVAAPPAQRVADKTPAAAPVAQEQADPARPASTTPDRDDNAARAEAVVARLRKQREIERGRLISDQPGSQRETPANQEQTVESNDAAAETSSELAGQKPVSAAEVIRRQDTVAATANAADAAATGRTTQAELRAGTERGGELARMDRVLQEKSLQIEALTRQVETLQRALDKRAGSASAAQSKAGFIDTQSAKEISPIQEPKPAQVPTPVQPAAKASQTIRLLLWGLPGLLVLLLAAFALRQWIRSRRASLAPPPAEGFTGRIVRAEDEVTTGDTQPAPGGARRPGDETGPYKVRLVTAENTEPSEIGSQEEESDTPEELLLEIDVRLAYEFYSEALEMLQQARRKFGDASWIDAKTLEIYAATGKHREFMALFEEKRDALKSSSSIVWAEIEDLRAAMLRNSSASTA